MDNTPEPDPNKTIQQLTIPINTLTISLINKKLITQKKYNCAHTQAIVIIDQEYARKRDETKKES